MADEEDLRRLHAGDIDLSKSDLRGADLAGLDLRGRDLTGANLVADLSENLELWTKENGRTFIGHSFNAGLIGATSAFFAFCGAPTSIAFGTAAALIGGKPLVEAAGGFLKSALGKSTG